MDNRQAVLALLSEILFGRPVRWGKAVEDCEHVIEIFNAEASEQRDLIRAMRPIRKEIESLAGGPVVTIFHTRAETIRLYADMLHGRALETPRESEPEFHDGLVDRLYNVAMGFARARWPAGSDNLHARIALNALQAATLRAEAATGYQKGDAP